MLKKFIFFVSLIIFSNISYLSFADIIPLKKPTQTKEEKEKINQMTNESQNIAQVVNGASEFGWQIVSANSVILKNDSRLHYIYMSK